MNRDRFTATVRRRTISVMLAASFLLAFLPGVQAQSARPDTRKMTCAQAQALVKKRGSVVMTTGPSTFEKFISDARYCVPRTISVRPVFAPTRDNPQCAVGNRCFSNQRKR